MSAAPIHDACPPALSAWCSTCRSTQPCAPSQDKGNRPASPPYRCLTCGQITPNPVIRLLSRRTSE